MPPSVTTDTSVTREPAQGFAELCLSELEPEISDVPDLLFGVSGDSKQRVESLGFYSLTIWCLGRLQPEGLVPQVLHSFGWCLMLKDSQA